MKHEATMERRTKSAHIADSLRYRLRSGHFAPGVRFYSNNTLSTEFGVSPPTAGKILDELCRDGLVERIHGSGTYVTEPTSPPRIATYATMLWIDFNHPLAQTLQRYDILSAFERACTSQGKHARLINLDDGDHRERLEQLLDDGLDGVLLLPPYDDPRLIAAVERLQAAAVPMVRWISNAPQADQSAGISFDDYQCGRTATEHLLAMGHQQITSINHEGNEAWARQRVEGYRQAMTAASVPKRFHRTVTIPKTDMTPSSLIGLLRLLRHQGCTALVATNDILARELILAGRAGGIRFPEDLAITGVDNRQEALLMGLTTLDRSADALARAALSLLQQLPATPGAMPQVAIECQLIVRTSTGQPLATATH